MPPKSFLQNYYNMGTNSRQVPSYKYKELMRLNRNEFLYSHLMLHLCYTCRKPLAKKEEIGYYVSVTKQKVLDYKKYFFTGGKKDEKFQEISYTRTRNGNAC